MELEEIKNNLKLNITTHLMGRDTTIVKIDDLEAVLQALENSISKDKIRKKIEEWDKSIKWNNADDRYYAMEILQELLEE